MSFPASDTETVPGDPELRHAGIGSPPIPAMLHLKHGMVEIRSFPFGAFRPIFKGYDMLVLERVEGQMEGEGRFGDVNGLIFMKVFCLILMM